MAGIQLGEEARVHKLVSNFLHSGHLVMISVDGLIEVMGIQAQAYLPICLLNIGNGGYPVHGLIYRGDHSQSFHLVEVFLDLWAQGDGHFLGSWITGCTLCQSWILYLPGNLPMPMNQSGNSFIKSSVDLMDLAAVGTVAGLVAAVVMETGAGLGGFVPDCMTVMAQFIFTSASFLLEGRPRMAGLGVSAMYWYELTWWG